MKRPPIDEFVLLKMAVVAKYGWTTANGNALGTTLVDASLIGAGAGSFEGLTAIIFPDEAHNVDSIGIIGFTNATGTIQLNQAYKGGQILAGTRYVIANFRGASVAAINAIFDLVNAMLVTTETGGTITTNGAEQDVYINNAPAGVYEPKIIKIDFTAQTAAETVVVRTYYRYRLAGLFIQEDEVTFAGVQSPPSKPTYLDPNRFGIWVSMQRTAGGAIAYDWYGVYRG